MCCAWIKHVIRMIDFQVAVSIKRAGFSEAVLLEHAVLFTEVLAVSEVLLLSASLKC